MRFTLILHSHMPWVLHHGRWPHGSDWLTEAALDTYLPLLAWLERAEADEAPVALTLGVTPILAAQLAHPSFGPTSMPISPTASRHWTNRKRR